MLSQVDFLLQRSRPPENESLAEREAGNERLRAPLAVNGDKCDALLNSTRFCGPFVYRQRSARDRFIKFPLALVLPSCLLKHRLFMDPVLQHFCV